MPIESEQLDRDALLMLYAADELSPAQAAELEGQLAADPSLAAQLQRIRDLLSHADDAVRAIDEAQRLPVSTAVAARSAARIMQQWSVDRLRNRVTAEKKVTGVPWWIYPSAAAAVLIVGFLIWSGRQEVPSMPSLNPTPDSVATAESAPVDGQPTTDPEDLLAAQLSAAIESSNNSIALAVDNSAQASAQADSTDDSGAFFLSPREESSQ